MFFSAFFDDLVGHFRGRLEGRTTMDQLADYVPPGLLDEGLTIAVVDRRWEASRALPAALVLHRFFRECHRCHQLEPVLRGRQNPDVDQSLVAVGILDPYESEVPELPEPELDGSAAAVEFLLKPAVPLPACVGAEAVQISEKAFLGVDQLPELLASDPRGQSVFFFAFEVILWLAHFRPPKKIPFGLDEIT